MLGFFSFRAFVALAQAFADILSYHGLSVRVDSNFAQPTLGEGCCVGLRVETTRNYLTANEANFTFLPLPFLVPQTSDNLVTSVHG